MTPENDWTRYCRDTRHVSTGNRAILLTNGGQVFPAMLDAIRQARSRIWLEMYTFAEDSTGLEFRRALEEKAREGVQVRVLFDGVGCLGTSYEFFRPLEEAGAQVFEYHPLAPWKPHWNWFRRDHRKLLIADGVAFVGGLNLTQDNAPHEAGGKGWRDSAVRLEGPCVDELDLLFLENWELLHGHPAAPPTAKERLHMLWTGWKAAHPGGIWPSLLQKNKEDIPPPAPAEPAGMPVRVLSSTGIINLHSIRKSYLTAIDRAQHSIRITNAYFLPGRSIYHRLIKAANRGVSVKVILPYETDHPYVRWASRTIFGRLLANGVELYEYQSGVLHAKTAVIDGLWSTLGSHNLDHRSLRYNLEVNVTVFGREFGSQLEKTFDEDLKQCRQLDLKTWKERPFHYKLAERVLYYLRYSL